MTPEEMIRLSCRHGIHDKCKHTDSGRTVTRVKVSFPLPHNLRPAVSSDLPLLINAWVSEHRHSPAVRFVRDTEYFVDQRALVIELLRTSSTIVACGVDDAQHIYGFITYGPGPTISWTYVKSPYRRIGLADVLLDAAFPNRSPDDCLFATQAGRMWAELEPLPRRGEEHRPGALTRRRIYYRPHLLMRAS